MEDEKPCGGGVSSKDASYDSDLVEDLIEAATGTARILNAMAEDAYREDYPRASAYRILYSGLWQAVENLTGDNPLRLGE